MNPLTLNPLALVGGALVVAAVAGATGWTANGWRLNADLAELRAQHADAKAEQAVATVTTMQADAKKISTAARQLLTIQQSLGPQFDALKKEIKNAKPLPVGCVPDAVRVRNLDAAIDAANKAAARQ